MTAAAFARRAARWVVLWSVSQTLVDWIRQRPDPEPNFVLWLGLAVWAADATGATWPRWKAVLAAEATGAAYAVVVVALQAVVSLLGGADPWRPSLVVVAIAFGVIAPTAYFQARSARRQADASAVHPAPRPGTASTAG